MGVIVEVDENVIVPVIFDVHMNQNDTLIVIVPVDPVLGVDGIDHPHGIVHVQVHGHDHGSEHDHGDDHVNDDGYLYECSG